MGVGDIMARNNTKKSKKGNNKNNVNQKNNKNLVQRNNELKNLNEKANNDYRAREEFTSKRVTKRQEEKHKTINKARRELIYSNNDSSDELSKLIKIVLIVTGIMIVFYGITVFVTRKVDAAKTAELGKSSEKASIQYDNIIIGSMYKIEGDHYVFIQDEKDEHLDEYMTLLQTIEANDEAPKVYIASLDSSFNKSYLGKGSNYSSDLSKFKVTGTTLVEVSDHSIKSTYDNYDSIKGKLDELK